jgi:hypothetical protein
MEENKNTYIFKKNIVTEKGLPNIKTVYNYAYEHEDGDELVFSDSLKEAYDGFDSEDREGIKALYGGSFPKELVTGPKDGYDYFAVGLLREDGHRKFYVYPDKTLTADYL